MQHSLEAQGRISTAFYFKMISCSLGPVISHINIHQLQSFEFTCEDERISPVIVKGNFSRALLVQGDAGGLRE